MENRQNCQLQVQEFFPTVGISDADYCFKRWKDAKSEALKEAVIKKSLIHLSTNREQHQFLSDFSQKFTGYKRVQILNLCKKILLQHPEKVIQAEHYNAFQEYYDYDINTDTSVTATEWIDFELDYLGTVVDNRTALPIVEAIESIPSNTLVENNKLVMSQEEILIEFGWKNARTISRRVKDHGFPATKDGKYWCGLRARIEEWALNKAPKKFGTSIEKRNIKRL